MAIGIIKFHHANVTVPRSLETVAKQFYGSVLGLEEVAKPEATRGRGGAWYQIGEVQLHLSVEETTDNHTGTGHICFVVQDLRSSEKHLAAAGIEILPDPRPVPGTHRFYVRDPADNLIEIAERKTT
jgi:catechol 2,3-dioxygenase-like lactoylglutathione lyase family enzyme